MWVSMFTDPGTLSSDYIKHFDMLKNIDKNNLFDPNSKNVIDNLISIRRSRDLDVSADNKNYDEEGIIIDFNQNNNPITMDSFNKMFNTDIQIELNNEANLNLYFKTSEFFFKFLYYTRELQIDKLKKNRNYCIFCKIIRPERSHHCKECRKCILKMDHHCGILNTCVGHKNYKPWMTFVFYSTIHLLLILVTMIDGLNFYFDKTHYGKSSLECNLFVITFIIVIISFFSVGELLVTHLLYISKGVTTIEDKSESLYDQLLKRKNDDLSQNRMYETLGSSIWSWFSPKVMNFEVYDGYIWLNSKSYEEYINERRQEYLKTLHNSEFNYEKLEISLNNNNLYDSIREPI